MGATYGPFLLDRLPDPGGPKEKMKILSQFSSDGCCWRFREILDGRAVQLVHTGLETPPDIMYLEGEEADAVLALQRLGGSRPYSHFRFLDSIYAILLVPDEGLDEGRLDAEMADGSRFRAEVRSQAWGLRHIARATQRVESGTRTFDDDPFTPEELVAFHAELADEIRRCSEAGVMYMVGDT